MALTIALLLSTGVATQAQTAEAGTAPSAAALPLQSVAFQGNTVVSTTDLSALANHYIGKTVTLTDLEKLATQATEVYRTRGFFLAQVIVPQQQSQNGRIELTVLEGRLGQVRMRLAEDAPITQARINALLAAHLPLGAVMNEARYERAMLLLSDLPGVKVQAGLEQGAETGSTDLVLDISAASQRWQVSIDADNHGSAASGRERASLTMRYASPLGLGDNLDARIMSSANVHQTFGRLSYEAPVASDGLRLGLGLSRVQYELGSQFAVLGASGTAQVVDASALYPVIRSRGHNLFLRIALENKALKDNTAALGLESDKSVAAGSLDLSWEGRDALLGGGYINAATTLYAGRLRMNNEATQSLDQNPSTGHQTAGGFIKLILKGSRLQSLFGRNNLFISLAAQASNRNLDSSEKFGLGGDRGVRAYPSGEALVDAGLLSNLEWRYSATDNLVLALFHDAGHGLVNRQPNDSDAHNKRTLRGAGLGVNWSASYGVTLRGSAAWRLGGEPSQVESDESKPRWLVQIRKIF
jgi:hemolysin activation/secretion protein